MNRVAVKATAEGMSLKEFEDRFVFEDGSSYKASELWKWYGEEQENLV